MDKSTACVIIAVLLFILALVGLDYKSEYDENEFLFVHQCHEIDRQYYSSYYGNGVTEKNHAAKYMCDNGIHWKD